MKIHPLWIPPVVFAVLVLVTRGTCSAFPPKKVKGPMDARRYSPAFLEHNSRRSDIGLFACSSSSSSNFSPDTNAQRKSRHHHNSPRQHRQLHSSISVDGDLKEDGSSPVARAMDNAWTSVTHRLSSLQTRGGALRRQRRNLPSTIHAKRCFRSFATTLAAPEPSSPVVPKTKKAKKDDKLSKIDFAIFVTYFCNIAVVTLSVVTVPAIALEHNLSPSATAAFCASMASMAPLGGFVGKLVNGFVCQYLGGQRSSWVYLLALSSLCLGMSFSNSLASVGLFLVGFDFFSSIQWTSISSVLNQQYFRNSRLRNRGFTLLSISSTVGALSAKIIGAGLLRATQWRTVCRFGSLTALVGAAAIFFFGGQKSNNSSTSSDSAVGAATSVSAGGQQLQSPLDSLKVVLGNPIFWMIGIGHSLGHLARTSDRLLGPFLQEVGGISSKSDYQVDCVLIVSRCESKFCREGGNNVRREVNKNIGSIIFLVSNLIVFSICIDSFGRQVPWRSG